MVEIYVKPKQDIDWTLTGYRLNQEDTKIKLRAETKTNVLLIYKVSVSTTATTQCSIKATLYHEMN